MGGVWLGASVRVMARSLVFRVALTMAVVAAVVVAVGVSATAAEPVTVDGEYVEFEGFHHYQIGPFSDLATVFHPGGVGPEGVPCTADTVTVVRNEVVFTFDPASGSVTGTGLLELSCEYNPGCGAVNMIMEAAYDGDYDVAKQLMRGTVDYWSLDSEFTNWGTKGGLNPVSQCLDRTVKEGEAVTTNWVLDVGEANPFGYHAYLFEGSDPAKRYGFFTVPLLVATSQDDATASAGDNGESALQNTAGSGDQASSTSGATAAYVVDGSGSIGMKALVLLLAVLLFGIGSLAFVIHRIVKARMGFRE